MKGLFLHTGSQIGLSAPRFVNVAFWNVLISSQLKKDFACDESHSI
jgi:hypothetical protein